MGKFVEVEIRGLAPQSYFRIPRPALQTGNEVWTVREDKKVSIVPVRVLQRVNDEVFAMGDLEDGQLVIVGGIQFVTEGMVVQTGTPWRDKPEQRITRGTGRTDRLHGEQPSCRQPGDAGHRGGRISIAEWHSVRSVAHPACNTIEVSRSYPGAMPEEVEESIGVKIEEQVSSLDDAIPRYGKEYATKRELSHPLARPVSRWPAHYQTGATTFVSQRLDER